MRRRPLEVWMNNESGWLWHCRVCNHGDGTYLYRDDAIHFGVYHLRAHQPSEETA